MHESKDYHKKEHNVYDRVKKRFFSSRFCGCVCRATKLNHLFSSFHNPEHTILALQIFSQLLFTRK